jgi:hypothetical protein
MYACMSDLYAPPRAVDLKPLFFSLLFSEKKVKIADWMKDSRVDKNKTNAIKESLHIKRVACYAQFVASCNRQAPAVDLFRNFTLRR